MNLLLLEDADLLAPDRARVDGRRHEHLREILRIERGSTVLAGLLGGAVGSATVTETDAGSTELELSLDRDPPPKLPLRIALALPRPKVLGRLLSAVTTLGVRELVLFHASKVEKSYWQSPTLHDESIERHIRLGLEQACDTIPPVITFERRFRPFVETTLPPLIVEERAVVAHPYAAEGAPLPAQRATTLVIGPEGGFNEFEIETLIAAGVEPFSLGERILRVETVVPFLVGKLFP